MITPPTGTVTFLFTDIAGSTRLWEERPDEMRVALAEHDALVRAAIDAHGGYVSDVMPPGFSRATWEIADRDADFAHCKSVLGQAKVDALLADGRATDIHNLLDLLERALD